MVLCYQCSVIRTKLQSTSSLLSGGKKKKKENKIRGRKREREGEEEGARQLSNSALHPPHSR